MLRVDRADTEAARLQDLIESKGSDTATWRPDLPPSVGHLGPSQLIWNSLHALYPLTSFDAGELFNDFCGCPGDRCFRSSVSDRAWWLFHALASNRPHLWLLYPKRPKNVRNGFGYVWLLRKCSQAGLNAMATPGFDFLQPGASCQDIPVGRVLPWQLQVSSEIVGCGWRSFIRCARRWRGLSWKIWRWNMHYMHCICQRIVWHMPIVFGSRGFVTGVKLLQTLGASGAILCKQIGAKWFMLRIQGSCNYEQSLCSTLFSIPWLSLVIPGYPW